jgi:hypothetical protein
MMQMILTGDTLTDILGAYSHPVKELILTALKYATGILKNKEIHLLK